MGIKKKFLLRIDEGIFSSLEKWAADDLRSVNSQIEYLLIEALKKAKRLSSKSDSGSFTDSRHDTGLEKNS